MGCKIDYIPSRLHTNNRQDINEFYIAERLFRRCKEEEKINPFDTISLSDVSVNREGSGDNKLSLPEDVLYNMNPDNGKGEKLNLSISYLNILELNNQNQYFKILCSYNVNTSLTDICQICLKHKKEDCNYSHSAFVFCYNGVEISNFEIYKNTWKNKKLRTKCKNELSKMIIKEEVRINW